MIKLGIITRTRDNDGTFFIDDIPKNVNQLIENAEVFVGFSEGFAKKFIAEKFGKTGKGLFMKLKEINSAEDAVKYKEQAVFIDESNLKEPENYHSENEFVGFKAINKRTNEVIGIIVDELDLPANNVLVVKSDDKEYLIPVVPDFIDSVNKRLRIVKINPIDGLLNDLDD